MVCWAGEEQWRKKKESGKTTEGKKKGKKKTTEELKGWAWILSDLLRSEEVGGAVEIRGVGM